jgi:hypothetical protein
MIKLKVIVISVKLYIRRMSPKLSIVSLNDKETNKKIH